jgi:CYTH domain-containing protein
MVELEKTYLLKYLPNLTDCPFKEIFDIYLPKNSPHPKIRLRKNGDHFEMTKKEPIHGTDSSEQLEQTIILTETEFLELAKIGGKELRKLRYQFSCQGRMAEIDVFQDLLKGLVLVDFEFNTVE